MIAAATRTAILEALNHFHLFGGGYATQAHGLVQRPLVEAR